MRTRHRMGPGLVAIVLAVAATIAAADQVGPGSSSTGSAIPRMPDGRPDLQGTYDLATLTPLQRPAGLPAVMTDAEAGEREQEVAARLEALEQPLSGDRTPPPTGGDGSRGAAGNVGGYNTFWLDGGSAYTIVNGERRTSLIVDPPDGRVPPLTAAARSRLGLTGDASSQVDLQQVAAAFLRGPDPNDAARENDPGWEGDGRYDDPEQRPLGERCLMGFGSTAGPPVLPNYFYNNLHQIVQTADHVMILTEMVHDARVVRIGGEHLPPTIRRWMGDSIGHWEGDTLVVETTNFTDKTRFRGSTEKLRVVERFTRVDEGSLLYRFTVEDPDTWERPWTGEYTWPITQDLIYEYACHEANYSLTNILKGARLKEANDARKPER